MELRAATIPMVPRIWEILQDGIAQRKEEGSDQWQKGYPNEQTILDDIAKKQAFVLINQGEIVAYAAVIFGENPEPAYLKIKGKWLSSDPYGVVHRVATAKEHKGKGIASLLFEKIEELSRSRGIPSIKVDTNFDNKPMLRIMEKLNYTYCGEVWLRDGQRKAFEKLVE